MKKVNFKMRSVVAIAICLAAIVMTSCGGGSSNKGAAQTSDSEKTEAAKPAKDGKQGVDINGKPKTWEWESNEFTAILSKPNGTIRLITNAYGIYSVQMFWTIEEAKAYGDILASDNAFTVTKNKLTEAGSTKIYNFEGTKENYSVSIREAGYGGNIFAISISKK